MEIDYAFAFITFLVFTIIAISIYIGNFNLGTLAGVDASADKLIDDLMGYLEESVYEIPARYGSSGSASDKPLYINMTWDFGQSSTRVYNEGTQVDCKIEGNAIHWVADLHDGWNYFTVKFANNTEDTNCTGAFSTANENQTEVWATEKSLMILQSNIDAMLSTGYDDFKTQIGTDRDFRVEINTTEGLATYGKSIPAKSSVYLRERRSKIFENSTMALVSVWVW